MVKWKIVLLIAFIVKQTYITLAQHGVLSVENLALDKPTNQSLAGNMSSSLAVNGNYEDYSQVELGESNWWRVNLQKREKILVINVHHYTECCDQFQKTISIYTTQDMAPGHLSQTNSIWIQRYSRTLSTDWFHFSARASHSGFIEAMHVGVIGEANKPLSLQEVEVFGQLDTTNVARDSQAIQSQELYPRQHLASEAVNGILTDRAAASSPSFWEVDLGATYSCELIRFFNGQNFTEDNEVNIKFLVKSMPSAEYTVPFILTGTDRPNIINFNDSSIQALRFENQVTSKPLTISEVEVFVANNPAFNKPTRQSTTDRTFASSLAINGFGGDFSLTRPSNNPWWTVDLLAVHCLSSVDIIQRRFKRLASVLLFTSKKYQEQTSFDQWMLSYYRARVFGPRETIPIPARLREVRHIAIQINQTNSILALAEVIVNEFNFAAEREGVYQSSVYTNNVSHFEPENAVDNLCNTSAVSDYPTDSNQWWRLELNEIILMTSIKIHFQTEECVDSSMRVNCVKVAAKVNISTSLSETGNDPSEWKLCHSQPYIQSPVQVGCDRNHRQPFTRHLIIQPQSNDYRIALAEVEVFGRVLPRFAPNASAIVHSLSRTSATLVFHIWNTSNTGAVAPTTYLLTVNDEEMRKFYPSHARSGKITVRMNELDPRKSYDYEITCWFRTIKCLGESIKGRFTTLSCPAPSYLDYIVRKFDSGKKYRRIRIDILDFEDNCVGTPELRVTVETVDAVLHNQTGKLHFIRNVARDITLVITISITNVDGRTKFSKKYVKATNDVPAEPVLKYFAINSTCVHLQVSNEDDLLFAKMLFKFTCSHGEVVKEGSINAPNAQKASQVLCGFTPNSSGSCKVTVENNIGESEALIVNSTTKVEVRTMSRTPEITTKEKKMASEKPDKTTGVIAALVTAAVLVVLLITGLIFLRLCFWKKKKSAQVNQLPAQRS